MSPSATFAVRSLSLIFRRAAAIGKLIPAGNFRNLQGWQCCVKRRSAFPWPATQLELVFAISSNIEIPDAVLSFATAHVRTLVEKHIAPFARRQLAHRFGVVPNDHALRLAQSWHNAIPPLRIMLTELRDDVGMFRDDVALLRRIIGKVVELLVLHQSPTTPHHTGITFHWDLVVYATELYNECSINMRRTTPAQHTGQTDAVELGCRFYSGQFQQRR